MKTFIILKGKRAIEEQRKDYMRKELYDKETVSDYLRKSEEVLQWIEKQLKLPENSLGH